MIEIMNHVTSQIKEEKKKQITDTRDRTEGAEWYKKSNTFMLLDSFHSILH